MLENGNHDFLLFAKWENDCSSCNKRTVGKRTHENVEEQEEKKEEIIELTFSVVRNLCFLSATICLCGLQLPSPVENLPFPYTASPK